MENIFNYQVVRGSGLLVGICILFFFIARYLWRRRWLYYYAWKAPGPIAWPIIGNALWFKSASEDLLYDIKILLKRYRKTFRMWLGHRLYFVVTDPKDIQIVAKHCLDKDDFYDVLKPALGEGLVTSKLDIWKNHRKVVAPAFNGKTSESLVDAFEEKARALGEKLEKMSKNGIFDAHPVIHGCTLEVVIKNVFGSKSDDHIGEYVVLMNRIMTLLFTRMVRVWLHPDFIWKLSSLSKELDECMNKMKMNVLDEFSKRQVWYQESQRSSPTEFRVECLGDHLLHYAKDLKWSDEDICDEAITLTTAASDTTAATVGLTLIILGIHPWIQNKIQNELDVIFERSDRNITKDDIQGMMYLDQVIKETMRLFPPLPTVARAIRKDLQLSTLVLPKGSSCIIAIIGTHTDPNLWPDPYKYDPDRFLPEEIAKRHPGAYVPFSFGPRNCLGIAYGMMSMKVILATILRKYRVYSEYKSISEIKVKFTVTAKSAEGVKIMLKPRF